MATIKKAQNGAKTKDSTAYFSKIKDAEFDKVRKNPNDKKSFDKGNKALSNQYRQTLKGKPGYDANGFPKKKMKNGGSLSGLTASNKRDKGIDPKGAYTTVQKRTLAGAKGKASLTKDKQLGATKMAKRGMSIKKK
jgi:hypothetical protein